MTSLLWFRNDLRTHDNPALHQFLNLPGSTSPRKAIFFISNEQWQTHHWSAIKIDFIKRHAHWLVDELIQFNIELELVEIADFSSQVVYLKSYCADNKISSVIANSELEFNEQQRDKAIIEEGIPLTLFEADVVAPKGKVLNQSGMFTLL